MTILLDTSAYSLFDRNNKEVVDAVRFASEILMTPAVLAELYYGFLRGNHRQQNFGDLEGFLESPRVRVVSLGAHTADRYARIRLELRKQGSPIPMNDIWIAASALEYSAELITSDKHFTYIPFLKVKHIARD